MTAVSMYWGQSQDIVSTWSRAADLTLLISPPHSMRYINLLTSSLMAVTMRVIAPCFSFWAAFLALRALRTSGVSLFDSNRLSIGQIILIIELPVTIVTGVALVCGQYSSMAMPYLVHKTLFNLFSGTSLLTSVMLALFLYEESRSHSLRLPKLLVLSKYRYFIAPTALVLVGGDALNLILSTPLATKFGSYNDIVYLVQLVLYDPLQLALAGFFLTKVIHTSSPSHTTSNHSFSFTLSFFLPSALVIKGFKR
jgi:hypothetical protein